MAKSMKADAVEMRNGQVMALPKKALSESQGERALEAVMRKAKAEAIKRHSVAMETHAERLKAAITAGVARRQDLARDW